MDISWKRTQRPRRPDNDGPPPGPAAKPRPAEFLSPPEIHRVRNLTRSEPSLDTRFPERPERPVPMAPSEKIALLTTLIGALLEMVRDEDRETANGLLKATLAKLQDPSPRSRGFPVALPPAENSRPEPVLEPADAG